MHDKKKKKHSVWLWIIPAAGILLLALVVEILSLQAGVIGSPSGSETEATVHAGTAELADIRSVVPGAGTLEEEEEENLQLPDEVEIEAWYVSDGDAVEEGDLLARVDPVSVMSAIAHIQDLLNSLDEELAEAEEETVADTVTAAADGRVKAVYAEEGTGVADTMFEDQALMLISLDGTMAVSLTGAESLSSGDAVQVTLADGTEVSGRVESVTAGTAVVTYSDKYGTPGEEVTVSDEDGDALGTGTARVHSELKVTGFTGTVEKVAVSVGEQVSAGDTLLTLTDTDYAGTYDTLLLQRAQLEEQMRDLFALYEEGYVYAPCSGVISGLTDGSAGSSEAGSAEVSETGSADASGADAGEAETGSEEAAAEGDTASAYGTVRAAAMNASFRSSASGFTLLASGTAGSAESSGEALTAEGSAGSPDENPEESEGSTAGEEEPAETEPAGSEDESTAAEEESTDSDEDKTVTEPVVREGYKNYIGVVTELKNGKIVLQFREGEITVTDYSRPDETYLATDAMDEGKSVRKSSIPVVFLYSSSRWTEEGTDDIAVGDILILTVDADNVLQWVVAAGKATDAASEAGGEDAGQAAAGEAEGSDSDTAGQNGPGQTDLSGLAGGLDGRTQGDLSGDLSAYGSLWQSGGLTGGIGSDLSSLADAAALSGLAESVTTEDAVKNTYSVAESTRLSVTPQDTMSITITIDEMDILSLAVGQEAEVTLSAFPGQSFEGEVTSIDTSGTNSGGSTKYTAAVTIPRGADMLAGMNASVIITLSVAQDVLTVPEDALVEEDGRVYVYTSYDEASDTLGGLTEVATGLSDGEQVEILDGLSEGSDYYYSILDVVNYSSAYASAGGFSLGFPMGGAGGGRAGR